MAGYDIDSYRKQFPLVDAGRIYLNHAATSPLSKRVVESVDRYLLERSQTVIDNFAEMSRVVQETRQLAAKLLGAGPDRIAFMDNTSNALSLAAAGLEWHAGDRVILNDIEFPSNVYPFLNLKRLGVEIDIVRNRDGKVLPEDLEAAIGPRTRLLSISHVQFLSGFRADLEAIGEICRRRGVIFVVDAIQSAGVVPIDVKKMSIDFLAAGGQKWLMAPQGIAIVYVSEEMQSRLSQAYLGWTSISDFFSELTRYRLSLDPTARRYENGTLNHMGIAGLRASLSTLLEIGIGSIEGHVLDLNDKLIEEIHGLGFGAYVEGSRRERAGIVSFHHPDAGRIFRQLAESRIDVAVREGWVRVSPHFYNTDDDVRALLGHLKRR